MKTCTKCNQTKPLSEFHRHKDGKDGRNSRCKICMSAYKKKWYQENKEHVAEWGKQYYQENREYILERQRKLRKRSDYQQRYYQKHKERKRRQRRNNYWSDPERHREMALRWQRNNPQKVAARRNRRRARKSDAEGSYTAEEFAALCERYGNQCLACGSAEDLTADHVIPLAKGGSNYIDNIQPLCHSCNCSKQDSIIDYRNRAKKVKHWKQPVLPFE